MIVNRYTQLPVAQYNPMSMQELAMAPTFLRQRHDAAQEGLASLDQASNEYNVLDQFGAVANQAVQPFQKSISELADKLASEGVQRSQAIPQAIKLKSQYQQLFGQQGTIGQLQGRTQQVRSKQKEIQEFFEKNPELAQGALKELKAGEATIGEDGKLQLGDMQTPSYLRHYDAKEVNDIINSQIDNIKDTLIKDYGFSNVGTISSIQDVYMQGQLEGRSKEEITQILASQLSPEIINSARQYGRLVMGDEKAGELNLMSQLSGAAQGRASQKLSKSYSVYTNEDRKYSKDSLLQNWAYDKLPGASAAIDPDTKAFYDNAVNYEKVKNNPNLYIITEVDGAKKIRVDNQGNPLKKNDPNIGSLQTTNLVDYIDIDSLKNSSSKTRNMTSSEFIKVYQNYMKDIESNYEKAITPVGENMSWLQERVVGSKNKEGLLSLRQIRLSGGSTENMDHLIRQSGYKDMSDFYENSGVSLKGYVPSTGSYAVTFRDNKNKSRTLYVEADPVLKNATINTIQMSSLAKSGVGFMDLQEPANVGIPGTENLNKYFINDYKGGIDNTKLVLAPAGLSEDQLLQNINNYVAIPLSKIRQAEQAQFQSDPDIAKYFK